MKKIEHLGLVVVAVVGVFGVGVEVVVEVVQLGAGVEGVRGEVCVEGVRGEVVVVHEQVRVVGVGCVGEVGLVLGTGGVDVDAPLILPLVSGVGLDVGVGHVVDVGVTEDIDAGLLGGSDDDGGHDDEENNEGEGHHVSILVESTEGLLRLK